MSERLSGPAEAERRAAESIAAREALQAQVDADHDRANEMNFEFDFADAKAMDKQIKKGAKRAEKIDGINDRYNSAEGRDLQEEADVAIFGSHGRTEGYVDEDGDPITEPILGKVDEIRDAAGIEAIRVGNTPHGNNKAERMAIADQKEAENNAKANEYVRQVEELRAEGFELSQVKVIMDKREERQAREQRMFENLTKHNMEKLGMSAEQAKSDAAGRVMESTVRNGDDEALLMRVIKAEGIMDMNEYIKFRYKRGNPDNGERKEYLEFKKLSLNEHKDRGDLRDRANVVDGLVKKEEARQQAKDGEELAKQIDKEIEDAKKENDSDDVKGVFAKARRSLKKLWYKAGAEFAAFKASPKEYFTDEELGKRRKIVAGAAAAAAVAGAVYLAAKSGNHEEVANHLPKGGSGNPEMQLDLIDTGLTGEHGADQVQNAAQHGAEQAQNAAQNSGAEQAQSAAWQGPEQVQELTKNARLNELLENMPNQVTMVEGDNPWNLVKEHLVQNGAEPSNYDIDLVTDRVLKINGITSEGAHHLPVGTVLQLK